MKCIRCGGAPSDTKELNIWTRKGLIHVGCVPPPTSFGQQVIANKAGLRAAGRKDTI